VLIKTEKVESFKRASVDSWESRRWGL